jgi:hypothetical protein
MLEISKWENTPTPSVPCSPEAECQVNDEAASLASHQIQPFFTQEEEIAVFETAETSTPPVAAASPAENTDDIASPTALSSSVARTPVGTLKVKNANTRSDAGGTINLGQLEPFCKNVRTMPMYTVFEATVLLPSGFDPVVLFGYINRYGSTSYWGDQFIQSGNKCRVVWDEEKLGPLPGRGEAVVVELLDFAVRNGGGMEVAS